MQAKNWPALDSPRTASALDTRAAPGLGAGSSRALNRDDLDSMMQDLQSDLK